MLRFPWETRRDASLRMTTLSERRGELVRALVFFCSAGFQPALADSPSEISSNGCATQTGLHLQQFAEALGLRAADRNFRLLLIVHFQHVARLEPGKHFLDVVDIHQMRTMRPPEPPGIERLGQFLDGAVIRTAFQLARGDRNRAAR